MSEEMRTFGYLCPKCGKPVMGTRSIFALEASDAEIACECGGACCVQSMTAGTTGYMSPAACAPKPIWQFARRTGCSGAPPPWPVPKPSSFAASSALKALWKRTCGELVILAEKEKQQQEEPEAFADNVIMYEILSELKDIAARPDGITCACGSNRCGMEIRRSSVDLVCRDCGARRGFPPPRTGIWTICAAI